MTTLATHPIASPSKGHARGLAVASGLLLAAAVVASGWVASRPLPVLAWAAAIVFFAVERDLHCQRIPNWLTFPACAAALVYGAWIGGMQGVLEALLGALAAFALLVLPYGIGALGAGDVKAAMALGAGLGAGGSAELVLLAIGFGGAVALARVAARGELLAFARRWGHSLTATLIARRFVYFPPAPGTASGSGIPFAVAIALAVTAHSLLEISR
jgi:prepilin peptidase CpaA